MAKIKEIKIDETDYSEMASSFGAKLLSEIESIKCWVDTGILSLNYVISGKFIGGGIPSGRIVEIFGDSASGKSLIGTNILKGTQTKGGVPILLDAERSISKEFAVQASKIEPTKFIVLEADTLEKAFHKINNAIRKIRDEWKVPMEKPVIFVYDSIAASPSEREFSETKLDLENATQKQIKDAGAGVERPGERAKICSKELRNLPGVLEKNNASVVFINQIRQRIGIMFGDDTTTAGGGRALEYYSSVRLKMRANKISKDAKGNILGVNVSVRNVKNRCFRPFVEADKLYLFFEQGINPFGGLLQLLLQIDRIDGSGGNYTVKEPWANGQEIKFKSSLERNDIPTEVLLKCPKLVDAESPDQIKYYLNLYKSAIDAVDNDIAKEEVVENVLED